MGSCKNKIVPNRNELLIMLAIIIFEKGLEILQGER